MLLFDAPHHLSATSLDICGGQGHFATRALPSNFLSGLQETDLWFGTLAAPSFVLVPPVQMVPTPLVEVFHAAHFQNEWAKVTLPGVGATIVSIF